MPHTDKELLKLFMDLIKEREPKLSSHVRLSLSGTVFDLIRHKTLRPYNIRRSISRPNDIWIEFQKPSSTPRHFLILKAESEGLVIEIAMDHVQKRGIYKKHIFPIQDHHLGIEGSIDLEGELTAWVQTILLAPDLV